MRALAIAALMFAPVAAAQAFSHEHRLLLSEGTLRGSPRLMGIAGAFVGVAEGAEGITRNPASAAMKDPKYDADFQIDFAFAMHFLPPWGTRDQDWDNDGNADQAAAGPFEFLGTQVIYLVASLQWKSFAFGAGVDLQNFLNKTPGESVQRFHNVALTHAFATVAGSFWYDQILVGLGIESTHAFIGYGEQRPGDLLPTPKDAMGFHGWGLTLGGVYRPENTDWRVGLSYKPQLVAPAFRERTELGGLITPSAIDVPGRLSLGGAIALGSGRKLNITSPLGWAPRDPANPTGPKTTALMKWLISVQLDVFFPVQGATTVGAFLNQPERPALVAGNQISFQPRVGVEKELFIDLLRIRAGSYLEPPFVSTGPVVRPHLTAGFELFLFKLGHERISFGISFDWANLYQNLSFGFLVWK